MSRTYYNVSFYLKGGRLIQRKATVKDAAVITGNWELHPDTKLVAFNFEHPESAPVAINLDVLEYIDFREVNSYV